MAFDLLFMNADQVARAKAALGAVGVDLSLCPECRRSPREILPYLTRIEFGNKTDGTEVAAPTLLVTCVNCGYSTNHSTKALKLDLDSAWQPQPFSAETSLQVEGRNG